MSSRLFTALILSLLLGAAATAADGEAHRGDTPPVHRWYAYVGAFHVTGISTHINVFSQDLPIGVRVDIAEQFGFREALTVPRLTIGRRFGKRHVLALGWYDLERSGEKVLFEEIDLPGKIIPEGTAVEAFFGTEIFRLTYNWLFHKDEKVSLGIGGGFFVGNLSAGLRLSPPLPSQDYVDDSFTAPLPVLSGSLVYRLTPKLDLLTHVDWLMVDYEEYRGGLLDLQLFANHRTFKHVGFGGGINVQAISLDIDDEELYWQIDTDFIGLLAVESFSF